MSENQSAVEPQEEVPEVLENEEVVETTETEESEEKETSEGEQEEKSEDQKEEPPKKKGKSIDDRVKELARKTWEMREAERKANEAAENLKKLQQQQSDAKKPNPADYDDDEKYHKDTEAFYRNQAQIKAAQDVQIELQRQQATRKQAEATAKWDIARSQAIADDEEFERHEYTVARTCQNYNNTHLVEAITSSDISTKLVSYLGKNAQEADRLASMSPLDGARELGKLEAKLTQKPAKKISRAPAPVNSERGGMGAPKDIMSMSQEEYNKYMNSK